jgi:NAD(P)-dependent dehydrogenase (short-subunit alcohol dehydrogenase family)
MLLLTGGNGGLASAFVAQFLKSPYAAACHCVYTVRDPAKALSLYSALKHAPKEHNYEVGALDLTALENVRTFAANINKRVADGDLPLIKALVLHASIQIYGPSKFTSDGIESTLAVNYLANFLLVLLLLKSMDPEHGRIVHISSNSHAPE